jgi:hypothetical protein
VLNKVDNDVVANALIEFAVQLGEACAQHIMAAKQDVKRLPKGIDIELALQSKGSSRLYAGVSGSSLSRNQNMRWE